MDIKVNRDSVCMGDDVVDHSKVFKIDDDATYEELFQVLKEKHYFPSVSGNNVVWVLTSEHNDCILSYFTSTDKFSVGLSEKSLNKICGDLRELHLKYYSNPQKWKEKIQMKYHDDTYAMWRDGWLEEIKYCDYHMAL